jgi:murein DD-endopeptidase MepM/ murein hydrolase activator NlpD
MLFKGFLLNFGLPMKLGYIAIALALVGLMVAGVLFLYPRLEGEPPSISLSPEPTVVGKSASFTLLCEDRVAGIKEIRVELLQGERVFSVLAETYPRGTSVVKKVLEINPQSLGLREGETLMRAEARDRSWRRGGNPNFLEMRFMVDTRPPSVEVLSRFHYINQGGTGLVVYRASEKLARSGVEVGDLWFPGYPVGDRGYITFFAVPYDVSPKTPIALVAEDRAGNRSRTSFPYRIKLVAFRKETIHVDEDFLQRVMPYFTERDSSLKGNLLEVFLRVNGELRKANEQKISELCRQTAPVPLWSGPFLRMANAKPMARFADQRVYLNGTKEIDRQVHLGEDLASLAMSVVEAANRGRVVFAGELGIYGNAIILDHGCGLSSMYAHLSRMDVQPGQEVTKGQALGITGSTGLAGGDHLHFSILVSGVYVNPIEWWDPHWLKDNVEDKLALLEPAKGMVQ